MQVLGVSYRVSLRILFQAAVPPDAEVLKIMSEPELNARFSPKSICFRKEMNYQLKGLIQLLVQYVNGLETELALGAKIK